MRVLILASLLIGCDTSTDDDSKDPVDTTEDTTDTVDTVDTDVVDPDACANEALAETLEAFPTWDDTASCGHVWFGVRDGRRRHAVTFNLGTTQRDFEVGDTLTADFAALQGQQATLTLQVGQNLGRICTTDVDTGGAPTVGRSWTASEGVVTVEVTEVFEDGSFDGTVTMSEVVLTATDAVGDRCPMPGASWATMRFGTSL